MDVFGSLCETFFCCRRSTRDLEEKRAGLLDDEDLQRFARQKFNTFSAPPSTSRRTSDNRLGGGGGAGEGSLGVSSSLGRSGTTAGSVSATTSQPVPRGKFETNKSVVIQLRELATSLEGPAKKFPHHGIGFSQNRYLAATPIDEESLEFSSVIERVPTHTTGTEDKWYQELRRWRRGWLAYWADQESFTKGSEPKGHVDLMKIAKIDWAAASPRDVLVRHREAATTHELYLQFETKEQARQWRESLHKLRALLQRTVKHM